MKIYLQNIEKTLGKQMISANSSVLQIRGSLRGPNDDMVIQTDADAENHWKPLENNVFAMLRTFSATTVCCGANAAQRTATVIKKPLQNVGKTNDFCKIKRFANPGFP